MACYCETNDSCMTIADVVETAIVVIWQHNQHIVNGGPNMANMSLREEEAAVIKLQFGHFLTGKITENNLLVGAWEATMHTDSHNDTHNDGC
jgi:hypothetical protein